MKLGKDLGYLRNLNNLEVIRMLQVKPCSGTEIASALSLSTATVASIITELLSLEIITVSELTSIKGVGRKRILYKINDKFGYILSVNISNQHAVITVTNLNEDIIITEDFDVEKYNKKSMQFLLNRTVDLLREGKIEKQLIKHIVISLPGRVNIKTGELQLSTQFDPELFAEKQLIKEVFNEVFPDVEITLANDIKTFALGEQRKGQLKDVENAIFISLDYGIGGALIANGKIFYGDNGYTGEFGLLRANKDNILTPIDEIISLRALMEKAYDLYKVKLTKDEFVQAYYKDQRIHKLVLESAEVVGQIIKNLVMVYDINTFVIGGRVALFDKEYLNKIKEFILEDTIVSFSSLKEMGEIYGASHIGVKYLLQHLDRKKK